jgi:glycosyltransferase involved in cell wall biosynthesis
MICPRNAGGGAADHELRRLYARSDIFVMPTRWESFGLAALEARCSGLPVLAMRQGGVFECLREGIEACFADNDRDLSSTAG